MIGVKIDQSDSARKQERERSQLFGIPQRGITESRLGFDMSPLY